MGFCLTREIVRLPCFGSLLYYRTQNFSLFILFSFTTWFSKDASSFLFCLLPRPKPFPQKAIFLNHACPFKSGCSFKIVCCFKLHIWSFIQYTWSFKTEHFEIPPLLSGSDLPGYLFRLFRCRMDIIFLGVTPTHHQGPFTSVPSLSARSFSQSAFACHKAPWCEKGACGPQHWHCWLFSFYFQLFFSFSILWL